MAADRELIREFLTSLGFQVDQPSLKKFFGALADTCKWATKASASVAGLAVGAEVMVQKFASGMEKLYYSSRRTDATIAGLQGLRFAAEQIGMSGDSAVDSIEAMAAALRTNPGFQSVLRMFGVAPAGGKRDQTQVFFDMIRQLRRLPHFVGAQWAEMFGLSERDFLMWKQNLEGAEDAYRRRLAMNKEMGADVEKWGRDAVEFKNTWRLINEQVDTFGMMAASKLLPYMQQFQRIVAEVLGDWQRVDFTGMGDPAMLRGFISEQLEKWGEWGVLIDDLITKMTTFLTKTIPDGLGGVRVAVAATGDVFKAAGEIADAKDAGARGAAVARLLNALTMSGPGAQAKADELARAPRGDLGEVYSGAEMDAMDRAKRRPSKSLAQARADVFAKGYDLENETDPDRRRQLHGEFLYLENLLRGLEGAGRAGAGGAPGPVSFNAVTNISVAGDDPASTARAVAGEQSRVYADLVRNFKSAIA